MIRILDILVNWHSSNSMFIVHMYNDQIVTRTCVHVRTPAGQLSAMALV